MKNKKKVKIGYLFQDQYPWDIRAEKFIDSLTRVDYELHVISRNRDNLPEIEWINDKTCIHRLPHYRNEYVSSAINFPAFFSPFWIKKIQYVVKKEEISLLIVRDLPLSLSALFIGYFLNIKVVIDMAENYPALIQSTWKYRGIKFTDFLFRNPLLLSYLERLVYKLSKNVIVVSEFNARRIINLSPHLNVTIVGNTPRNIHNREKILPNKYIFKKHSMILLYVGFVEAHRGLQTVILAAAKIKTKIKDFNFIVVGEGTYKEELISLSQKLGTTENVTFVGWISHKYIPSIIDQADICIIPHYVTDHVDTTIPNKIFDYMKEAKPIIYTQSRALISIIDTVGCGRSYNDDSSDELVDAVLFFNDQEKREIYGAFGRKAVVSTYNWSEDKKLLLNVVKNALR